MGQFKLGQLLATPGVLEAVEEAGDDLMMYLSRHARGDWGTVGKEDWRANDRALVEGTLGGFDSGNVPHTGRNGEGWL